jgi:hypothetical protein
LPSRASAVIRVPVWTLVWVATSINPSPLVGRLPFPACHGVSCLTAILYATGEERALVDATERARIGL